MKNIILAIATLACFTVQAQYYYNDIISTGESNRQMKTFLANKVKTVSAKGVNPGGMQATDFTELREVKENGMVLKVTTRNNSNTTIYYNRFDNQGRLISISDSSTGIQSITTYQYDATGKILLVINSIKDTANDFNQIETHQWIYNIAGIPEKMWRIINQTDSLEIRFAPDENGNIVDERTYKKRLETAVVYYYYDEKNRLSDIVRFNKKLNRLIPDIMFEYDDSDRVVQKITTTSSLNLNYLIWRYLFNEKGLKTKEALFNKDKELTGKIEYNYTFGQ